jgi:hypothetical protein
VARLAVLLSVGVAMLAGLFFAVAWADYGNQGCARFAEAGWMGNNNCADAWWLMLRAGPVALVCLMGAWLGNRLVNRA